jgi:predicted nuclease of predicted toxin-antitoxin system
VTFYLDEDLSPVVAQLLRERGLDAISAHEIGFIQVSDQEQLDHAAAEGRALVTRNARDFRALSTDRVQRQQPHAGIIVCPPTIRGSEHALIAQAIERLAEVHQGGLGPYDLAYLSKRCPS